MNNNQKKELKLLLKNRITTIEKEVDQLTTSCKPVHLDQQAVGRVSRIDAIQSQQMALNHKARLERQVNSLKQALIRIEKDPHYGLCEECGEVIAHERLFFAPNSTLCMACLNQDL
tara:strand:+ start:1670 stop:2017 length:348 start_codon:yes stop_codon:yes gene_type:complete